MSKRKGDKQSWCRRVWDSLRTLENRKWLLLEVEVEETTSWGMDRLDCSIQRFSIRSLFLSLSLPSMTLCTPGGRMMKTLHWRPFAMTPSSPTMGLWWKTLLLPSVSWRRRKGPVRLSSCVPAMWRSAMITSSFQKVSSLLRLSPPGEPAARSSGACWEACLLLQRQSSQI